MWYIYWVYSEWLGRKGRLLGWVYHIRVSSIGLTNSHRWRAQLYRRAQSHKKPKSFHKILTFFSNSTPVIDWHLRRQPWYRKWSRLISFIWHPDHVWWGGGNLSTCLCLISANFLTNKGFNNNKLYSNHGWRGGEGGRWLVGQVFLIVLILWNNEELSKTCKKTKMNNKKKYIPTMRRRRWLVGQVLTKRSRLRFPPNVTNVTSRSKFENT